MDKENPKKQSSIFVTIGSKPKKELAGQEWDNGKKESAAAIEPKKEEEEFQWLFPEKTEQKEEAIQQYASMQRPAAKQATGKLLIIVISAVCVGVLLGYALVKVVTQKEEPARHAILQEEKQEKVKEKENTAAVPAAPKGKGTSLSSIEPAVVQGGVFSTKEAAEAVKRQINGLDLPAEAVQQNGQYIVLLATASTVETAKMIGELYKASGADTYAKQVTVSSSQPLGEAAGEIAALFPAVAEESGKQVAGRKGDQLELQKAEKALTAMDVQSNDRTAVQLKKLLTEALTEAKSDQPQAAKAAQEKLLAFLSVYSQ
ncbi:Stage II sporulation protein B [Bacillus badius]|uniref:Stage II sporulation protein B n=2 Tax=Bacillus badius TaxID=1455 RepID=A0ABR5AT70_BACBA|nr:Stage II sporulation protein B [Bacillus badius]KIL77952.1 Stage II sporulation protein B [Bacillus badius]